MAQPQIVVWRAALALFASVVLALCAMFLLGWRTDLAKGEDLKEVGIARTVQLMQESSLPSVVPIEGLDIPIRYSSSADGVFFLPNSVPVAVHQTSAVSDRNEKTRDGGSRMERDAKSTSERCLVCYKTAPRRTR